MIARLRWFLYGVVVTLVACAFVVRRARVMKERLDAQGVANVAASLGADAIERAGRTLQRSAAKRTQPDPAAESPANGSA